MISRAREFYAELLREKNAQRYSSQGQRTLAFLRDFIAEYERRDSEEVQNQYERDALDEHDRKVRKAMLGK